MTGAATSVIGKAPTGDGVYNNSLQWANKLDMTKPNERAKYLAERVLWDDLLKF
jgi:hypothetical protein